MPSANQQKIPVVSFDEARRFFRQKVALTRAEFDMLAAEAKRRAFTAAAVHTMDVLHDIRAAVDKMIDQGKTLADFNAALLDIMGERGWTGTTPWHAETIFRTNIQSAYGAGRFEQLAAVSDEFPYAMYVAVDDDRTREEHAELDGTVAPIDGAFWAYHWPPWDYNCRCSAEPLSADEVKGEEVENGTGPMPENDFTSPALGADYEPDLSRFDPDEQEQLRRTLR